MFHGDKALYQLAYKAVEVTFKSKDSIVAIFFFKIN